MPEVDGLRDQEPVRTRWPERHADAPGVQHPGRADYPVELHVRMPAHHELRCDTLEDREQILVRRQPSEPIRLAPGGAVAEEDRPEDGMVNLDRSWPGQEGLFVGCLKLAS